MARKIMPYAKQFLGKIVAVTVDRPMGNKHPKYENVYPVNYGFIKGVKAPDGKDLDAYVLGVFIPLKEFTGKCIAIIHRIDDNDDKLIVVPKKTNYSKEQIIALTEFQERFFKSKIMQE